jgi:hypothetical protein
MEKIFILVLSAFFLSTVNYLSYTDQFQKTGTAIVKDEGKFTSKKGKFKIQFPGEPSENKETVDTDAGKIDMVTYMYEQGTSKVFMVAYSDYPADMISSNDSKDMLKGAKEGFTGNLQLTIDFEEFFMIDGYQGLYFKASNATYYSAIKQNLVKNRLYQIGILSAEGEVSSTDIQDFLETFELTN